MNKLLYLLLLFACSVHAQNKTLVWDYPVKPGSDQWKSFTNGKEMVDACQIPQEILENLSTAELAEVCLKYPLRLDYMAFNDQREGVRAVINHFNGLKELAKRVNAGRVLMEMYDNFPVVTFPSSTNEVVCDLPFLEILLSENEFIDKLNNEELTRLEKKVLYKYEKKLQNSEIYSLYNVKSTMLIGAVAKYKQTPNVNSRSFSDRETLKRFIDNFSNTPPELITEVSKILSNL